MASSNQKRWYWVPTPGLGGAGGRAAARVMDNNGLDDATLMAREVIQNSWDAAQVLRTEPGHEFVLKFKFIEYKGSDAFRIREQWGLDELTKRVLETGQGNFEQGCKDLEIPVESCLSEKNKETLRVLMIEDYGTHGLYGNPNKGRHSHLYKALYVLGVTGKDDESNSGGSYGFGKSALINGSRISSVIAYSCFRKTKVRDEFETTTRRAVGWTWWKGHELGEGRDIRDFEGRAILGELFNTGSGIDAVKPEPLADNKADQLAKSLDIPLRNSENINELGTTFALVDPVVDPKSLVRAIEDNWWPALVDEMMDIEVIDYDGTAMHPKPRLRTDLKNFIRCYEIATRPLDNNLPNHEYLSNWNQTDGKKLGKLALKADETLADGSDDSWESPNKPVIVFVRKPRMVIEYFAEFQRKRIPIRGVFVADDEVDKILKGTEPPAHSEWDRQPRSKIPAESTRIAKAVVDSIRRDVNKFAVAISPAAASEVKPLKQFNKFFRFAGDPKVGPDRPVEGEYLPIEMRFSQKESIESIGNQHIKMTAGITLSLKEDFPTESTDFIFDASFNVLEDETRISDILIPINMSIVGKGFVVDKETGTVSGRISKGKKLKISLESEPYEPLWSGQLVVNITPVQNLSSPLGDK